MSFVLGNSVRVLKVAVKKFSVRPCWIPILLKLQNSTAGVFQWDLKKILEHLFYRTTANCYLGTKKGRWKYWSSIVLFESRITESFRKNKVQIFWFLLEVSFRYHTAEKMKFSVKDFFIFCAVSFSGFYI